MEWCMHQLHTRFVADHHCFLCSFALLQCSINPFLPSSNNGAGFKAPNTYRPFGNGKENVGSGSVHKYLYWSEVTDSCSRPGKKSVHSRPGNVVRQACKNNPFCNLSGKVLHGDCDTLLTPMVPKPPKLLLARFNFLEQLGRGGQPWVLSIWSNLKPATIDSP